MFLVPFTLSMEIVGGRETVGILPWVTFKTLLGNKLDNQLYCSGGQGDSGHPTLGHLQDPPR